MMSFFRSIFAPPRNLILPVAALWIGLALAEKQAEHHKVSRDALTNIVYYSLFGYIVGGRGLYALENYSVFLQSPLSLFSLNLDLFDPSAAVVVALIVGLIYGSRRRLQLWPILDALTPLFACLGIGFSLSHLAAGTAFGSPTELPWGIELWNANRHPTQIYEFLAASLVFIFVWFRKPDSRPGTIFLAFAALTSASRLFLEGFRGDSTLIFGGVRLAQVLAWIMLAAVLVIGEWIRVYEASVSAE
jgi:phosphatidylglycerol:prolipoprotein diacylglycerol transferase